jgi:hypothetical protein
MNTCVAVTPGEAALDNLGPLVNMLTYEDDFTEQTVTLGIMMDKRNDTLYIHKGIDIEFLRKLLINTTIVEDLDYEGEDMKFQFEELIAPRNEEQVDVINFIAGEKDFEDNRDDSRLFVVKKPGFGKMQPLFAKIATPQGYVKMKFIRPGSIVFDSNGNECKVVKTFDHGPQKVYKVEFTDGRSTFCGDEHLWRVKEDGEWHTKPLYEIRNSYMSYMTRCKYRYEIPKNGFIKYPWHFSKVDPFTYGICVGLANHNKKHLTFDVEYYQLEKVRSIVMDICNINDWEYRFENNSFEFLDKTMRWIKHDEIFYNGTYYIPKNMKYSSTRLALLGGILESMVWANNARVISSNRLELLNDIIDIFRSCGCYAKLKISKYSNIASIEFGLSQTVLCETCEECRKYFKRWWNTYTKRNKEPIYIKDVKEFGTYQCRCIQVDNPEHLYLTDDYVVTHNTYCTGYGIGLYKKKALIIMHRDSLRTQWNESLYMMNGFEHRFVHEIADTKELYDIACGNWDKDYDIYLITHATFRAGLKRIGDLKLAQNIVKNLGIGVKIIDEAHLEFKDILLLDIVCNVKRNIYLTATPGRSQREENKIYWYVFKGANFYAPSTELNNNMPKKWMNYVTVRLSSECNPNIYRWRVNGGKGMNAVSYGKWVIEYDKKKRHFKCCKELVMQCFDRDQNAKVLILIPLISLCDKLMDFLIDELDKENQFKYALTIRTINSTNSKSDNEYNKKADVIISTLGSMGVGTDVKGLTDIINMTPYCSKLTAEQSLGRVRYSGKIGHYYDIIDTSVPMDKYWWRARSKTLKRLSKKDEILDWNE